MAAKNCFDMTKLIFQIMCVTVVAVVKELFVRADKQGSTPGDAVFCFFVPGFFFFYSVPVTIQHHRVRHNSIPVTVRQYTGKFDIMHLMVRSNNIFVQYSPL